MALPELIANSPTPGSRSPLATLATPLADAVTTLTTSAAAPAALQGAGQFRIVVEAEIMLVTAGAGGTSWTVTRAVESSVATSHGLGAKIWHFPTAGALDARYARVGTDGTIGGPGGTALPPSMVTVSSGTLTISNASASTQVLTGNGDGTASFKPIGPLTGLAGLSVSNIFTPANPSVSAGGISQSLLGSAGGFQFGIDYTATVPGRDFFLSRMDDLVGTAVEDIFLLKSNASTALTTGSHTAGQTSIALDGALTVGPPATVMIGSGAANDLQEVLSVSAGSGTSTLTVSALAHPHPTGARVTVLQDQRNQTTLGMGTGGQPDFRLSIIADGTGTGAQPTMGTLKLVQTSQTADYLRVSNAGDSNDLFRIMSDTSVSVEAGPSNYSETAGTTNGTTTVQLSSVTASNQMRGCMITGTNIASGTFIQTVNKAANQVTISAAATGSTAGTAAFTIFKPYFIVRSTGPTPWFQIIPSSIIAKVTNMSLGVTAPASPQATLDIYGPTLGLSNGSGFGSLLITSGNSPGANVLFNTKNTASITLSTASHTTGLTVTTSTIPSIVIGSAALATSATDGFLYLPSCAGTPTGVPTTQGSTVPFVYDSTNNFLYVYNGGWKKSTVYA